MKLPENKEILKTLNTALVNLYEKSENDIILAGYVNFTSKSSEEEYDEPAVSLDYVLWLEEKLQNAQLEIKILSEEIGIRENEINIRNGKIDELQSTYIGQTDSLHCSDGELYIEYDENKTLVMNVEQLYKDLPFIISQVVKEQKKTHKMHLKMLKHSLKTIK